MYIHYIQIRKYVIITTVLVFDWNGNPVKQYELSKEAYYITIDKTLQRMYAVVRKPDMGWTIVCYAID